MYKLAPSMLAADFTNLGAALGQIEKAGAYYVHFDVMDGSFVPNISFGIPVLSSIRHCTGLHFDAHLMIINPERHLEAFAKAGADLITVHLEAFEQESDLLACLEKIQNLGKDVGLAISPNTSVERLIKYAEHINLALIMSVEPGFGGQGLLPFTLNKAEQLANFIAQNNLAVDIQMDGGIDHNNLSSVLDAGVNVVVAGSSVFGAADIGQSVGKFLETFESYEARR